MTSAPEFAEWPIERSELVDVVDALLEHSHDALAEACKSETFEGRCLVNLSCRLLQDILGFLVAVKLEQRSTNPENLIYAGNAPPFLKCILGSGGSLEELSTIRFLRSGLNEAPVLKRLARIFKELFVRDGFLRRPMTMIDIEEDIVSVSSQPLIIRALAETDRRVNLEPVHGWFPRISYDKVQEIRRREDFSRLTALIIDFTVVCASRMGISLQKAEIDILVEYLYESTALVGAYILQLEQRSRSIPLRLWSGSSGIIWIRMLQDAVLRRGGHVTGYDHAEGADFDEQCKFGFVELQTVNRFVTFNQFIADNFRRAAHKFNFTGVMPEIEFFQKDLKVNRVKRPPHNGQKIQKVLFLPPYVGTADIGLYPTLGPVQGINFVRKVLSFAADLHIHVVMKPHPEMTFRLTEFISLPLNVEIIKTGRSEDYLDSVDALLIDYPLQTTLGAALSRGLPIAILDTGQIRISDPFRDAISRRLGYVKVLEDGAGDWIFERDQLQGAINSAHTGASDTSFMQDFMSKNQG